MRSLLITTLALFTALTVLFAQSGSILCFSCHGVELKSSGHGIEESSSACCPPSACSPRQQRQSTTSHLHADGSSHTHEHSHSHQHGHSHSDSLCDSGHSCDCSDLYLEAEDLLDFYSPAKESGIRLHLTDFSFLGRSLEPRSCISPPGKQFLPPQDSLTSLRTIVLLT